MQNPLFDRILVDDLVARSEEMIEQLTYFVERKHVFILDKFAGRHSPTPAFVRISEQSNDWDFEII